MPSGRFLWCLWWKGTNFTHTHTQTEDPGILMDWKQYGNLASLISSDVGEIFSSQLGKFRVYRMMKYYPDPVLWNYIFHKPWNKNPVIKQPWRQAPTNKKIRIHKRQLGPQSFHGKYLAHLVIESTKEGDEKHNVECFRIPLAVFWHKKNSRGGDGFEIWETFMSKKPVLGLPKKGPFRPFLKILRTLWIAFKHQESRWSIRIL